MLVKIDDPIGGIWEYHMDDKLYKYAQKVKEKINKKDKDHVILVDGYEGSGKSTFAQQLAKSIDPTLVIDRVCMTAEEFKHAIATAEKGQCVIYDEAVTGLTAGDSISKVGKLLKSMMMQMRQKNLFVIIIIPSFFELGMYTIMNRAKSLFHVYESKGLRGYWVGYNSRDIRKLYLLGKKTRTFRVKSPFNGRFYGKYTIDEEAYREKKRNALENEDETTEESKYKQQRNFWIRMFRKHTSMQFVGMEELSKTSKYPISKSQISLVCGEEAV